MIERRPLKEEIKNFAESLLQDMESFNVIMRGDVIDFLVLPKSLFEKELLVKDKEKRKTYKIKISIRRIIDMESIAVIYSEFDDITKRENTLKLIVTDDTRETEDLKRTYEEIRQRIKRVIERSKELTEKSIRRNEGQKFLRF